MSGCLHSKVRFETVTIQPFTAAASFPMPPFQRTRCEDCGAMRLATGEWLSSADEKVAAAQQQPEWTLARWTLDQAVQDAVATDRRAPHIDTLERLRDSIDDLIASRSRLRAAEAALAACEDNRLEPIKYRVLGVQSRIEHGEKMGFHVEIEQRLQRDGSKLWAVTDNVFVLNADGKWEYEPIPSSRTDAFIARTRFRSVREAMETLTAPRP